MSTATERLRVMARDAIAEYNTETAAGGEPPYPDWARDLLLVLERVDAIEHERDRMRKTLENIAFGRVDPDKIKAAASAALQGESKS